MTYPREAIQSRLDETLPDRILIALKDGPMSTIALCDRLNMTHKGGATDVYKACAELWRRELIRRLHFSDKPSVWGLVL